MTSLTTYGPGGFDPARTDNNVVQVLEVEVAAEPKSIAELITHALSDLPHSATVVDLVLALRTVLGEQ